MDDHSATPDQASGFTDPTILTNWTRGLLYAYLASTPAWLWLGIRALPGGDLGTWGGWIRLAPLPVWATCVVLVLAWVYRTNCNVRALGATGLTFSPGWAAGWFLVPIAFFWKPFRAMRELWRASASPEEWQRQKDSSLLSWWWALWLLDLVIMFSFVVAPLLPRSVQYLGEGLLHVPLNLLLIAIIGRVHRMQMEHYRRQSGLASGG